MTADIKNPFHIVGPADAKPVKKKSELSDEQIFQIIHESICRRFDKDDHYKEGHTSHPDHIAAHALLNKMIDVYQDTLPPKRKQETPPPVSDETDKPKQPEEKSPLFWTDPPPK